MKSRIAFCLLVTAGFVAAGPGAAMAVSGPSGSGSAGVVQYPRPPAGFAAFDGGAVGGGDAQVARQVAVVDPDGAGDGDDPGGGLPFTGLAAVPLLMLGLVHAAGGLLVRRGLSAGREPDGGSGPSSRAG